jgi:asparagine synthase (glutamine-hydrolysing)
MCGIAGLVRLGRGPAGDAAATVDAMLDVLRHRGPDETAAVALGDWACAGSVRLSIVDASGSQQPLRNEDGSIRLFFNGEVYNHAFLRSALRARHQFRTHGDGEAIVHAYEDDPRFFARQLDGMFACALLDEHRRRAVLVRDRMGIKPLYYWSNGRELWFASELKSLLRSPDVPLDIDHQAVADFLALGFALPPRTFAAGVRQLEPGTMLVAEDGRVELLRYWDASEAMDGSADARFDEVFGDAVTSTTHDLQAAHVLLSGGIDSSAVAAHAPRPGTAYTVGYSIPGWHDERPWARLVAGTLRMPAREAEVSDESLLDSIGELVWSLDEPIYSSVTPSFFAVCRLAAADHRVVLTGDGADEVLIGYDHVRRALEAGTSELSAYRRQIAAVSDDWRARLLQPDAAAGTDPDAELRQRVADGARPAEQLRGFELRYRLPAYQLSRVDRLSMAHALEVRVPFLRNAVVDWALGRSAAELLTGTKQPLADACTGRLPAATLRRPKQKFSSPVLEWMRGPLRPVLREHLRNAERVTSLGLSPDGCRALLGAFEASPRDHVRPAWSLLLLGTWEEAVVDGLRTLRARPPRRSERPAVQAGAQ